MADTPAAPPKTRNPVERFIVWGLILALVVVTSIEGAALFGYRTTLSRLETALKGDEGANGEPLKIGDVPALVAGFPTRTEEDAPKNLKKVSYRWQGAFRSFGLHVSYRPGRDIVLDLQSDDAPPVADRGIQEGASRGNIGQTTGPSQPMGGTGGPPGAHTHEGGGPSAGLQPHDGPGGPGGGRRGPQGRPPVDAESATEPASAGEESAEDAPLSTEPAEPPATETPASELPAIETPAESTETPATDAPGESTETAEEPAATGEQPAAESPAAGESSGESPPPQ